MAYEVKFTSEAANDLRALTRRIQQTVVSKIENQLTHAPMVESRNLKHLQPNDLAEWELRVGKHRIFYNVKQQGLIVEIVAIGYKRRNRLLVGGKDYDL